MILEQEATGHLCQQPGRLQPHCPRLDKETERAFPERSQVFWEEGRTMAWSTPEAGPRAPKLLSARLVALLSQQRGLEILSLIGTRLEQRALGCTHLLNVWFSFPSRGPEVP